MRKEKVLEVLEVMKVDYTKWYGLRIDVDLVRDVALCLHCNCRKYGEWQQKMREFFELKIRKDIFDEKLAVYQIYNTMKRDLLPMLQKDSLYNELPSDCMDRLALAIEVYNDLELDFSVRGMYYTKAQHDKEWKRDNKELIKEWKKAGDIVAIRCCYNDYLDMMLADKRIMESQANSWVCPIK